MPPLKLDVLSKNRRQTSIPKLESYSKRPDIVTVKGITADFNNHQDEDFMTQKHRHKASGKFLGAMPFEKRPRK